METSEVARWLDLPFEVKATLAGPILRVSQLLSLAPGSLIATSHPAGASVDIFAGDAYIGSGELDIVNSHHAIRMVRLGGKS